MRRGKTIVSLAAAAILAGCGGASVGGPIGAACMEAGRSAATSSLCGCVQSVANQTLSNADQRRAARFFDDPDRAQETRTSDNPTTEAFWLRYRAFSDAASQTCG